MLTRTNTTNNEFQAHDMKESTLNEINEQVDERGFYMYEWITPDELRMSVQADYLSIVKKASVPLAIASLIFGIIGMAGGVIGAIAMISLTLGIFYTLVFLYLVAKMFQRSYLYTRGADVIITDNHIVTGGKIVQKNDFKGQKEAFEVIEKLFREPLFEPSKLKDFIDLERRGLFEKLKSIASGGGEIIQRLGRSRDAGAFIIVLLIGGFLYGSMMALVYFLGVLFVAVLARIFSFIAHRILLATNNLEHTIQTLYGQITDISIDLKKEKKSSLSLLEEGGRNDWKENLSKKIENSFEQINNQASKATEKSLELKKLLEDSKYRDIFNFSKYGNWIKIQILEPLDEIYDILIQNKNTLMGIQLDLDRQILTTTEPSLKKPLEHQKERIRVQLESFDRMILMISGYREKLQ